MSDTNLGEQHFPGSNDDAPTEVTELTNVQEAAKTVNVPAVDVADPPTTYVIQHGDTLDSIAEATGIETDQLYGLNSGELDRQASARGFGHSEGGRILFPGHELSLVSRVGGAFDSQRSTVSPAAEIARFHQLFTKGVITEDQWNAKRDQLLGL